jgi:hypothetical protein
MLILTFLMTMVLPLTMTLMAISMMVVPAWR